MPIFNTYPIITASNPADSLLFWQASSGRVKQITKANITSIIDAMEYGVTGDGTTDDTVAINLAIAAAQAGTGGGTVLFRTGLTYKIGSLNTITKPCTIDFNGSYIKSSTTGVMFTLQVAAPDSYANSITIKNATVVSGPANPSTLIKGLYGTINPTIENFNAQAIIATHSFIWNAAGYGMKITNCRFRNSTVPAALYFNSSDVDPLVFTNAVTINHVDISNIGGLGIYIQGGIITVDGNTVVEGCTSGGIQHGDIGYMNMLILDGVYFEGNTTFDVQCGSQGGNYVIRGCQFLTTGISKHIWTKAASVVSTDTNVFYSGGIDGDAPLALFVGSNSVRNSGAAGYTGTFDIDVSDALRGRAKIFNANPRLRTTETTITLGNSSNVVSGRPLTGTVSEEWLITGTFSLPAGSSEIFRVVVDCDVSTGTIVGRVIIDLQEREVLTLDVAPGGTGWGVGDIITGASSGAVCEIVSKTSTTVYGVEGRTKNFTLDESLSNGVNAANQGAAFPTCATASGISHSVITVTDTTGDYAINAKNLGPGAVSMIYHTTYVGSNRILP